MPLIGRFPLAFFLLLGPLQSERAIGAEPSVADMSSK